MPPSKISRPAGDPPRRSKSASSSTTQPAFVHRAQVVGVDTRNFTIDVRLEAEPYAAHFDVVFMNPYVHQAQGEGMNFLPEVGSTCWLCTPSEEGRDAFVMGWTTVDEDGTYRAGRELLNPGDLYFNTRDGNFLAIRRGGIVQIGAGPACQRIFLPIRNIIRDFAENYELSTPAGDLTWLVNRTEEQGDGHRGTLFTLAAKEFADDPNKDPVAVLKIGSHGEGKDTILSLVTRDRGGGVVKTNLEISKAGSIKWIIKKDLDLEIDGNYGTKVKGTMTTTSTGDMKLETAAALMAKGASVNVDGSGAVLNLQAIAKLDGTAVNLGAALAPVMIATPDIVAWLQAVTALLSGPASAIAFRGILPPLTLYRSTKVKA